MHCLVLHSDSTCKHLTEAQVYPPPLTYNSVLQVLVSAHLVLDHHKRQFVMSTSTAPPQGAQGLLSMPEEFIAMTLLHPSAPQYPAITQETDPRPDLGLQPLNIVSDHAPSPLGHQQFPGHWHPKLTGYHALVLALTAGFGLSKAVLAYRGGSIAPITIEWVFSVVVLLAYVRIISPCYYRQF